MEFYKLNDHRDNWTCHKSCQWLLHISSGNVRKLCPLFTTVWRTSAGPSVMLAEFAKDTPKEPEVALSRGRGEDGC